MTHEALPRCMAIPIDWKGKDLERRSPLIWLISQSYDLSYQNLGGSIAHPAPLVLTALGFSRPTTRQQQPLSFI